MEDLKTIVTPNILYLTELLGVILKGEIRVPNFQRPFVWKSEDMISLFESIYKGYPIGNVLFWETELKMMSLDKIGLHPIPKPSKSNITYILDGHQRISTLFGCLIARTDYLPDAINTKDWEWSLYFDLEREEFVHFSKGQPNAFHIALNKVVKTTDFLKECKRLEEEIPNAAPYIEKAEKLSQAIRTYKITITQIQGGNTDSAVEIFSRLNTKGMAMTNDQMFSALTYREGSDKFNLSSKIDSILEKLVDYKFSEIDRIFVFRAIMAAAKRDIYKAKLESLAKDGKLNLPLIVQECERSILKAARFLYEDLRVPGDKLLPYNLQFVFLSEFFLNKPDPTEQQIEVLKQWFWVTSYTGWFAGANSSKVKVGLENIRNFANGNGAILSNEDFTELADPIPGRFDFRFARVKVFILFLLSLKPEDLISDQNKNYFEELGNEGYKAMHPIYINNSRCANRLLLGAEKYGYAKRIFISESGISKNKLSSHGITLDAIIELQNGNEKGFLDLREEELIKLEWEFMKSKGVEFSPVIPRSDKFFFE